MLNCSIGGTAGAVKDYEFDDDYKYDELKKTMV